MAENKANTSKRSGDVLFFTEATNISTDASSVHYRAVLDGYENTNIQDSIKFICGSFWCISSTGTQKLYNKKHPQGSPVGNIELLSQTVNADGSVRERIRLMFRSDREAYDWGSDVNKMYEAENPSYDHTTSLNAYEQGSNLQEESAGIANHYAQIKTDYNFLETKYEELLSGDESIPETILPGFYNFLLKDQSERLRNILSLRGRISIPPSQRIDGEQEVFKPVSNYYNQWTNNFSDYRNDNLYSTDISGTSIIFTKDETSLLADLYKHKESFPMFATAEFTTSNDSVLGDTLEKTSFSHELSRYHFSDNKNMDVVEILSTKSNQGEISSSTISSSSKKFSDATEFFENYIPGSSQSNDRFFSEKVLPAEKYKGYYNLMSLIVRGKIERLARDHTRTYKEILDGKKGYTETILYRVLKYDESGQLLQRWTFPNTSKVDVLKFVDTQVKYEKRYTYKVTCQNIIFGTEYKVVGHSRSGDIDYKITVDSKPSIKLVEFDLFEKSVLVSDNPPIAPEILPIPFKNKTDKVKILLNSGIGRYMMKPIILSPEEANDIAKYKIAQDIPSAAVKIKYETDDSVTKFYVYRMDKKPRSYRDFIDHGTEVEVFTNGASSASIEDQIEPNKKYYYFARSEDYHANKSFPSVVYEVIIMNDTGSIYPVIKTYDFEHPITKQPTRGIKRFINVKASRANLFVDDEAMGLLSSDVDGPYPGDTILLGIEQESVWFKRFKIRLTSKSTGKKIDFNFRMKYRTKETTEEES